jgi:hypothetical protein
MFSIYFASINAPSKDEVTTRFNESKEVPLARYMRGMQSISAYLDAVRQPIIETLQALVHHAARVVIIPENDSTDTSLYVALMLFIVMLAPAL